MAVNFPVQQSNYVIGSEDTDATLTASYNDNTATFEVGGMTQLEVYIKYTVNAGSGGARDLYLQIEGGPESGDLYIAQYFNRDTAGVTTGFNDVPFWSDIAVGVTVKQRVSFPTADKFIRLSVKEDGAANFGAITVRTTKSGL